MGIKEFVKETIKNYKRKKEVQKELEKIKRDSYFEEMKKQNKIMGIKQAQIEAEMREKAYRAKITAKNQKKELQYTGNGKDEKPIDYFGLNRAFPQEIKII